MKKGGKKKKPEGPFAQSLIATEGREEKKDVVFSSLNSTRCVRVRGGKKNQKGEPSRADVHQQGKKKKRERKCRAMSSFLQLPRLTKKERGKRGKKP